MHELVAQVRDMLGEACALLADLPVGVNQRNKPPATFPRPDSALSRARKRVKEEREQRYDDEIVGAVEAAKARWRANQEAAR